MFPKQKKKRAAEDEMVGWHHQFSGHESEQTPGASEGQGRLVRCIPWGLGESGTTERPNNGVKTGVVKHLSSRALQLAPDV